MYFTSDPSTALRMAQLHQSEVRSAFGRRPRRLWRRHAVAAPPSATAQAARPGHVFVPVPRTPEPERVSA